MIMRLLNFRILILGICLSIAHNAVAGDILLLHDSTDNKAGFTDINDTIIQVSAHRNRYERRIHKYRKAWEALVPTHTKLQYAGGMGLIATGIGWDYGKRGQWETDILLGFIPRYSSDHFKLAATLKQTYIPWSIYLRKNFSLEPLECGLYFNTVFSNKFWTREPERYPQGYYGFSTKIRTHVFVGQRIKIDVPEAVRFSIKSVTLFYEISTCDLYVVSAVNNSYLKPDDYLRLSFGAKFQIF